MKKKFKLGMVGCGDIGRYVALGARLSRAIAIPACADLCDERASTLAKKYRIRETYADYREMMEKCDLDALYLSVPHHLHFPMIKEVLDRGLHVFCEKPITVNLDEALEICRLSRKTGLKVGVNYQYRYDSACYALARAVQKGQLGVVRYGRCSLPWFRDDTYFSGAPWHRSLEESGGGTLITQGSHILDALLWAIGTRPITAQGLWAQRKFPDIEVEDTCMGMLEMDDGCLIQVCSSMAVNPELPVSIEVFGSTGTGIYIGPEKPKVKFHGVRVKKERPPVWGLHALFRSMEGFRQWVLLDRPFLTPVGQSLPVLSAVQAIYKSSKTGRKEPVDDRYLEFIEMK